jgi:uncharacterized RDD family membrane protein YckC
MMAAMAEQQWYYAQQGQQRGPVSLEELRGMICAGQITRVNLVWREGMADWVQAGFVAELKDAPAAATAGPAPLPYGSAPIQYYNPAGAAVWYAGFWLRVGAYLIDWLVLLIPNMILNGLTQFALMGPQMAGRTTKPLWALSMGMSGGILQWVLNWLYFALMESSSKQETLGKMACGIIVTDLAGNRISFARATGRHFASWLSSMTIGIGYLLVAWTEKKQALHDMIANTLVVRRTLPQG